LYPKIIKLNTIVMKKIIIVLASLVLFAGVASAQDMAQATETYNSGAAALSEGNKSEALELFLKALKEGEACGEDGAELVGNCKGIIPTIKLSIAKDYIKDEQSDAALVALDEAIAAGKEYGSDETVAEAEELIPQVKMQKATNLLQAKDFAGAAAAYKEILESDPANGVAALRLGMALNQSGDKEGAIAAFETAAANGQESTANKQIGNIYLKQGSSLLKAKKYAEAAENAVKATEYVDNAQAYLIAGQAYQQSGKSKDAIEYFKKYLEKSPSAKNSGAITFTVAALYQQLGDKANALEYFNKVAADPQFGAQAKQQIEALKK
jgi:tetratricopeptide (TPR) repeat protein